MSRPPRICELRAAWWAYRCLRRARRRLAAGRTELRGAPPSLPVAAVRGVEAALRRGRATCLEAALVRQQWLAAQGVTRDVVIGVTAPSDGFRAHAWLAAPGDPTPVEPWRELTRLKV